MYPILKGEKLQLTPILILVHLESLSRFTISFVVYQNKKKKKKDLPFLLLKCL